MVVAVMVMRDLIMRLTNAVPTRRLALVDGLEGHVPAPVGSHWLLMILVLVVAGRGGARRRGHRASLRRGESLEEEVVVVAVIERARHHGGSPGRRRGRRRVRRGSMTLAHAGISIGRVGGHEGVASAGPRAGRVAHLDARAGANRHREIGLLRRPPRFITNVFYQRIVVPPVVVRNLERHLLSSHWSRSWQPVRRRTSRGASLLNTNTGGQTRASDSGTRSAPNKQGK